MRPRGTVVGRAGRAFARLFGRRRAEDDLERELAAHVDLLADEKVAAGMEPERARREASIELGGFDQVQEAVRDAWFGASLETFLQDVRYGLRGLRRNAVFSAVAIATLALGIGANTAIYSVLDAVLLRPLPYPGSDRLVLVWSEYREARQSRIPASGPELHEIRRRASLLSDVAGVWVTHAALTGRGEPERVRVAQVTGNFLSVLGVPARLGRLLAPRDEGPSAARTAVLADGLWRRRFGADPALVGRVIRLDGSSYTVVGIMPREFEMLFPADANVPSDVSVWVPFAEDLSKQPRDLGYVRLVARLREGASLAQAQSQISDAAARMRAEFREWSVEGLDLSLAPLHADAVKDVRPVLLALSGGVALVVLIACVNVANLLFARGARRQAEIALRSALGASRLRIARQLLIETSLLGLAGGLLGLLVGRAGLRLLLALRPPALARIAPEGLSPGVLAFTLALSLATGLLCGLAPALAATSRGGIAALRDGGRGAALRRLRPQRLLVLAEVSLGFLLLIGAGLLVRTFLRLLAADPGFRADGVLTFQIGLPETRYPDDASRRRIFRDVLAGIQALPGVSAAGAVSHPPMEDGPIWYEYAWREGAAAAEQSTLMADHRATLPGYFAGMGVRLLEGRDFAASDDAKHPNVVVVDETLARRLWGSASAIGKRIHVTFLHDGSFDPVVAEVVGVAPHVHYRDLTTFVRGQVYVPYFQSARDRLAFMVRSPADPSALAAPIRRVVAGLDPDLAIARMRLLSEDVREARQTARFTMVVAATLAALALALVGIGIYGLLAYAVAQRAGEMGIRVALGAQRGDIVRLVVGQAMGLVGAGLAVGLVAAVPMTNLMRRLLYGVSPRDLASIAAAGAVLAACGALAAYLPARRAASADPAAALRG